MLEELIRTSLLIGEEKLSILKNKHIAIFGIGGVGGYVCEALVRSGISNFTLIDNDIVDISNINRQIIALHSTIGKRKVEVMKDRLLDINPSAFIITKDIFVTKDNIDEFSFDSFDYIVDAIDNITAKIKIIEKAKEKNIPIISSMGTGNKINPTMLKISDLSKTKICPLARVLRRELRKKNIYNLDVLYSEEEPIKNHKKILSYDIDIEKDNLDKKETTKKNIPGSISFVPSTAGLIIASHVIKEIIGL